MTTKETTPRSIKPKNQTKRQDIQPNPTTAIERKIEYVDARIAEHFKEHGIPNPTELTDIIRTLSSVFSDDYSDSDMRDKSPSPKSKKSQIKKSA